MMTLSGSRQPRTGLLVQVGLLAGPFMSMIDSSVVNVALPPIARALSGSLATVQWVASAYLLALGLGMTATAYLAKRFGTAPVYRVSLAGFTIASGLCALAPNIGVLIGLRAAQGLFGAPMVPLAMNMLLGKGDTRSQMSPAAGMVLFLAPAVGPALGGLLIHWGGWPLIFLINLPVGLLAVWGARRIPVELAPPRMPVVAFDLAGFALLASGMVAVSWGATEGPGAGWLSAQSWPFWTGGALLLIAYALWATRRAHPIVDLSLLAGFQSALAFVLMAVVSVVTFAMVFLAPVFMQSIQGRPALVAGLALLPQGLVTGLGTLLGTSLPRRWGLRATVLAGMGLLFLSTAGVLAVTAASSPGLIAGILCGRGFAIGLVIQPLLTELIGALPEAKVPDGNTLFNLGERIGGTLGIALMVSFFEAREKLRIAAVLHRFGLSNAPALLPPALRNQLALAATAGFHDVILLVLGLSGLGLVMAWLIRG